MESVKHIENLGLTAIDKVTGIEGVITSVSFDLSGCVQYALQPKEKDGKTPDPRWYDAPRVTLKEDSSRAMDAPDFDKSYVAEGRKGPMEKPSK